MEKIVVTQAYRTILGAEHPITDTIEKTRFGYCTTRTVVNGLCEGEAATFPSIKQAVCYAFFNSYSFNEAIEKMSEKHREIILAEIK